MLRGTGLQRNLRIALSAGFDGSLQSSSVAMSSRFSLVRACKSRPNMLGLLDIFVLTLFSAPTRAGAQAYQPSFAK